MNRDKLKLERARILHEIEVLKKTVCENCRKSEAANATINCQCESAIEIRKLGDRLMVLVAPRAWDRLFYEVRKRRKMTVLEYLYFSENEILDATMIKELRIPRKAFQDWKREHNLNNLNIRSRSLSGINEMKRRYGHGVMYFDE